jgi:hypothetical protein
MSIFMFSCRFILVVIDHQQRPAGPPLPCGRTREHALPLVGTAHGVRMGPCLTGGCAFEHASARAHLVSGRTSVGIRTSMPRHRLCHHVRVRARTPRCQPHLRMRIRESSARKPPRLGTNVSQAHIQLMPRCTNLLSLTE